MAPAVEHQHNRADLEEAAVIERFHARRRLGFSRALARSELHHAVASGDRSGALRARERLLRIDLAEAAVDADILGEVADRDRLMGAYTALRGSAA